MRRSMRSWIAALVLSAGVLAGGARAAEVGDPAPEIKAGGQWFNSAPVSIAQLRGKVVLVNVWVFSCSNCQRSLPTLRAWYEKYQGQGFEIVGVNTPEFDSDRPAASVAAAVRREKLPWPVVQDNDTATWRAYGATAWPGFYLIDRQGKIRAVHEGEISSRYPDAIPGLEKKLQALLAEPGGQG